MNEMQHKNWKVPKWFPYLFNFLLSFVILAVLQCFTAGTGVWSRPQPEDVSSVEIYYLNGSEALTAEFSDAEHIQRACTQLGLLRCNPLVPENKAGIHLEPELAVVFHLADGTSRELEASLSLFSWNGTLYSYKADPDLFFAITEVYYFNDSFAERSLP